jgi:hypothetical protein
MKLPDVTQVYAFSRHVGSFASGAVFYAAMFGVVNSTDAANATHAIAQIGDGFKEITAGGAVLFSIGMGALAVVKSSPLVQMIMGAAAMLKGKVDTSKVSPADQKTIMEATNTLPKVDAVVSNDEALAKSASPGIVAASQVVIKS